MKHNQFVKIVSVLLLSICILLTSSPVSAFADDVPTGGVLIVDKDGNVVDEGYILYIATPEDVIRLAESCRVDTWSRGMYIVLQNDIDMTGVDFSGIPTFGGTFVGQGHTIKGFDITETGSVVGFFRYLQKTALVENLSLEGTVHPSGSKSTVGGFAGNNAGTISNCVYNGTVTGYEQIGGFAGVNLTSGVIKNCTVGGLVYGSHFVGGIAGENHGVIQLCENTAEINTKSVQNSVNIEDITMDNLINTESADTATDIGGIAGISSGVIRECVNQGVVGYKSMGYNVGGIAGAQNGYLVDCVNYADIQGRKEVGGIVGHMEPNIVLEYSTDSLQILSVQMQELSVVLKELRATIGKSNEDITAQMNKLEKDINTIQDALDVLSSELESDSINVDRMTAAISDMNAAIGDAYTRLSKIQTMLSELSDKAGTRMEEVVAKLDVIIATIERIEDNLDFTVADRSDEDTPEDTLGKVSNSINYGDVSGELNVGGVAGVLAEETDLDQYADVEMVGDISLNGTYNLRVVVRGCNNFGTVSASKQYAGGIAGQMVLGAVLECINVGNLNALNADYVGGIAGESYAVIRNCSSKSIIAGDTYVGGIAGKGNEVTDCYAFVSVEAYTEKAGAIIGYLEALPEDTEEDIVYGNYYYVAGKDLGGIDGIIYTGVADKVDLEAFLQLPGLDEIFKTVTIRFLSEGQEVGNIILNVGESLAMDAVPKLTVENDTEYTWKIVPTVTATVLGMGESTPVDYISVERLTNVLFDQTYEAVFDLKATVIQGKDRNADGLSEILANGIFAKDTKLEITNLAPSDVKIDGKDVIDGKQVELSNEGVTKLHYLIPSDVNSDYVQLYVKNASGEWVERDLVVDGRYFVFEFADGETAFGLVEDYSSILQQVVLFAIIFAAFIIVVVVFFAVKKTRKKKIIEAE